MRVQKLPENIVQILKGKKNIKVDFKPRNEVIPEGRRNEQLFRTGCALRRQGFSFSLILKLLQKINKETCNPPLSQEEVRNIAKSCGRYQTDDEEHFISISGVKTEQVSWFWYPYFPRGCITFLDGNPGQGKSFFTMYLAALCSIGGKLPFSDEVLPQGRVLILNAEDDVSKTIKPRLENALKDFNPENIRVQKEFRPLTKEGFEILAAQMEEFKPDLVIIDPILTYLSSDVDMNKFSEATAFMQDVDVLARAYDACILCVRHLSKASNDQALKRGLGSIGFAARARSVVQIGRSRDNEDIGGFAHAKHNWSERGPALLFELRGGGKNKIPEFFWLGTADYGAESLDPNRDVGRPSQQIDLQSFIKERLECTPMTASELERSAQTSGLNVSRRSINRALSEIALPEGKGTNTKWHLK